LNCGELNQTNMSSTNLDALCKHCGQALTDFLREMEKHNAKVVCPSCGKSQTGSAKGAENPTTHEHSRRAKLPADGSGRRRNQPVSSSKP